MSELSQADVLARKLDALNAVASAAGSGGGTPSKKPSTQGVMLKEASAEIDLSVMPAPQLQVTGIATLPTEATGEPLELIAVDDRFICYALKTGKVRVLEQATGHKALLDAGRSSPLTALRFCDDASGLLAAISRAGDVTVHHVTPAAAGSSEPSVRALLAVNVPALASAPAGAPPRLCWLSREALLVAAGRTLALLVVQEGAQPIKPAAEMTIHSDEPAPGDITCVAVSADRGALAVATTSGAVHLWRLPGGSSPSALVFFLRDAPKPATWPTLPGVANFVGFVPAPPSAPADALQLVAAGKQGCLLSVWTVVPGDGGAQVAMNQAVTLRAGSEQPNFHLALCRHAPLVVAANAGGKHVAVLHYNQATGLLDHAAGFSVAHPVLSLVAGPIAAEPYALYCVQTAAVQQLALDKEACIPPAEEAAAAAEAPAAPSQAPAAAPAPVKVDPKVEAVAEAPAPAPAPVPVPVAVEPAALPAAVLPPPPLPQSLQSKKLLKRESAGSPAPAAPAAASPAPAAPTPVAEPAPATPSASNAVLLDLLRGNSGKSASPALPPAVDSAAGAPDASAAAASSTAANELLRRRSKGKAINAAAEDGAELSAAPAATSVFSVPAAVVPPAAKAPEPSKPPAGKSKANKASPAPAPPAEETSAASTAAAPAAPAPAPAAPAVDMAALLAGVRAEMASALQASEASTLRGVEALLKAQAKRAEEEARKRAAAQKAELAAALAASAEAMVAGVTARLSETARHLVAAIGHSVGPAVGEALREALPAEMAGPGVQAAVERSLGTQLASALQRPLADGLRTALERSVVPPFEAATRAMFAQIERSFQTGMTSQLRAASGTSDEIASSLQQSVAHVQSLAVTMKQELLAAQRQLAATAAAAAAAPHVASGAASPAAPPQQQAASPATAVAALLEARDYEAAFTQALTAQDGALLAWLCRSCRLEDVFPAPGAPPRVSAVVLLTLVKALAEELRAETPMKLRWILEAATNLNADDPVVKPLMPSILGPVLQSLRAVAPQLSGEDGRNATFAQHTINSLLHT